MENSKYMYRLILATLLTGVFLLVLNGCDLFGGDHEEIKDTESFFSFQVYDESGELVQSVTSEQAGEEEIDISLGIFGNLFTPPEVVDMITKDFNLSPEDLKRNQIYLHAEKGIGNEVDFITLHFAFPRNEDWSTGTFDFFSDTKEQWLNRLKIMWEMRQKHVSTQQQQVNFEYKAEPKVNLNIMEHGLVMGQVPYIYRPTAGYLELEEVSEEHLTGNFSFELAGLSADFLKAEVFPENPEFSIYQITGNFVSKAGDYHTLMQARTEFFSDAYPMIFIF